MVVRSIIGDILLTLRAGGPFLYKQYKNICMRKKLSNTNFNFSLQKLTNLKEWLFSRTIIYIKLSETFFVQIMIF